MEKEVALDLFLRFLEKWGVKDVDPKKELPGLVAFGIAQGCFKNAEDLFDEREWRIYGYYLWHLVIDENKTARKLMKPWRAVINCLKQP